MINTAVFTRNIIKEMRDKRNRDEGIVLAKDSLCYKRNCEARRAEAIQTFLFRGKRLEIREMFSAKIPKFVLIR